MDTKNDIYTISRSKSKKAVFDICLEEACRQWCCDIDNTPERRSGDGFARFFYEIFDDKWKNYFNELTEDTKYKAQVKRKNEMER